MIDTELSLWSGLEKECKYWQSAYSLVVKELHEEKRNSAAKIHQLGELSHSLSDHQMRRPVCDF